MRKRSLKDIKYAIDRRVLNWMDERIDKKLCKTSLVKYVPSKFRDDENGIGSTGSESTNYIVLKEIFKDIELTEDDSFLDIGCGKGRVLAFLANKKAPCSLNGVEILEESGQIAKEWSKLYDNVNVTIGDAFETNFNDYTVFLFGRPFLPKTFLQFIEVFEENVKHKVTFIYWWDQQSGFLLKNRPGWTLKSRKKIYKLKGLCTAPRPQGCSYWEYNPENK